jgi:hypothetical protein
MSTVQADKAWERQATPLLLAEATQRFGGVIRQASLSDDLFHGTDFLWQIGGRTYRLACRIRHAAFIRYHDDFTIREDRPRTGLRTELEKIRAGDWAHVYAYGFSDGDRILHWSLFRMSRFNPEAPFSYMRGFGPNDQNDTVTRIYRISGQPQGFLLSSPPAGMHSFPQGSSRNCVSPTPPAGIDPITSAAIPAHQDQKRTAA